MPGCCHRLSLALAFCCAVSPALAGGDEMHIGRTAAGQLVAHVEFQQPYRLPVSVFPGISGFATGAEGFHSVPFDEPTEDIFLLDPAADIRATLVSFDPGAFVRSSGPPMLIGESMVFGELPFDFHPIFQIAAGAAAPGQVLHVGLVFHDASGHHADSDIVLIAFTPAGCPADIGVQGGTPGSDGLLDNNDFVVFINKFFQNDAAADVGVQGGTWGSDGLFDNNDFVSFITLFFAGGVCG